MNIKDLTVATKPLKLRHFNKETKSKILLDVYWSQLKGNKQPYLSVSIRQVKHNNQVFNNWGEEQKAVVSSINKDFAFLLDSHLSSLNGSGMHQTANMQYYFEQAKETFGKEVYTSEKHNDELKSLWVSIENHKIFETLFKPFGNSINIYLKAYLDKNSDKYKYLNTERSFNHWDKQIKPKFNTNILDFWSKSKNKKVISPKEQLRDYFNKIGEYKALSEGYCYSNLKSSSEVWTPDRLAITYDLSLETVFNILATPAMNTLISIHSDSITEKNKIKLEELTEKYKIPLVISK